MFFTQEDYKKIEHWIQKHSIKDTEFQEASFLEGEETITVVQGGHNRKVFIKDLVNQIFKLGISDFINITDKYKVSYIGIEDAIKYVPAKARKIGQVITFLNKERNWQIYQFKGILNQWNNTDFWEDLLDWEKLIINSILPDGEDLTKSSADINGNSYLSLKDRVYEPKNYSGLGRIILRKNVKEIEDPVYGKVIRNILSQEMLFQTNTVYEIRYDFDLNDQKIIIPEGCELEFKGGTISNGILNINGAKINPNGCIINEYIKSAIIGNYHIGQCVFNEALNKPTWWTGEKWIDATGADV